MKKLLFFTLALSVLLCLFAVTVCAAEPSSSNEFGEVTQIDSEVLAKRNDLGYSAGDTARVVLNVPGTDTYLTYPMYYVFGIRYHSGEGDQPTLDFTDINNATGYSFDATSIIRLEIPSVFSGVSSNYSRTNTMTNLKYVKMSGNMRIIHSGAFSGLPIEEVVLEDNMSEEAALTISSRAFANCSSLTSIALPYQTTSIGERCFDTCTALTSATFGARLPAVGTAAFVNCSSLATLVIPEENSLTRINHRAFDGCIALTGTYVFNNVTHVESKAFYNTAKNEDTYLSVSFPAIVDFGCSGGGDSHVFTDSGVCEVSLGENLSAMAYNTFSRAKRLWRVEFAGVAEGFNFLGYTFEECSALKAVSLPEGITSLPRRMFKYCTSLTAVYIPSTVVSIDSGDNDHATFKGCTNLYFVSEPFTYSTVDEIPAEPSVYYFPSGLITVSSEAFDGSRVNEVVVFPVGVTSLTQGFTFEGCTSASGKPTVVFMGDMETVTVKNWGVSKIFFANPADVSAESAGFTGSVAAVFCYGEGNEEHLAEKHMATEATCTLPKMVADFCFCGQFIPGTETTEGDPLGHVNSIDHGYVYENYLENGYASVECEVCGNVDNSQKLAPLFVSKGISAKTFGDDVALVQGYEINTEAISAYKAYAPDFDFGILVYANASGGEVAPELDDEKVVNVVFDKMANNYIDVKVIGVPESFKDTAIVICIYVSDEYGLRYIENGAVSSTVKGNSYNDIVG